MIFGAKDVLVLPSRIPGTVQEGNINLSDNIKFNELNVSLVHISRETFSKQDDFLSTK